MKILKEQQLLKNFLRKIHINIYLVQLVEANQNKLSLKIHHHCLPKMKIHLIIVLNNLLVLAHLKLKYKKLFNTQMKNLYKMKICLLKYSPKRDFYPEDKVLVEEKDSIAQENNLKLI